jgi:hypothetical protein
MPEPGVTPETSEARRPRPSCVGRVTGRGARDTAHAQPRHCNRCNCAATRLPPMSTAPPHDCRPFTRMPCACALQYVGEHSSGASKGCTLAARSSSTREPHPDRRKMRLAPVAPSELTPRHCLQSHEPAAGPAGSPTSDARQAGRRLLIIQRAPGHLAGRGARGCLYPAWRPPAPSRTCRRRRARRSSQS